jgi:hypothetical protein
MMEGCMSFTIKKETPVSIISDNGEVLGNEIRGVTYVCKITSITLLDETRGEATVSRSTGDNSVVSYLTHPFIYSLSGSIFLQAEKQIIAMKEYSGADST